MEATWLLSSVAFIPPRPSYAEGFTKLFYVYNKGDQSFEVSDWQEEESISE